MADMLDFKPLQGFHYSDDYGIVNVYVRSGVPTRRRILRLLREARLKALGRIINDE